MTGPRHVSRGCTAAARIVGTEVSGNLRGRSRFVISDVFRVPLTELMEELDTARPYAMRSIRTWPTLEAAAAFGVQGFTRPWLTYAMICGLVLVFLGEHLRAIALHGRSTQITVATLHDLGALDRDAVLVNGEWYRVFLAPLRHGNVAHIVANSVMLLMAGRILERLAGCCWMLAIFILGGFGGSIMPMAANPPDTLSVGASSAIMALFAAIAVRSFRLPEGDARSRAQARTFRILIPLLLPAAAVDATYRLWRASRWGDGGAGRGLGAADHLAGNQPIAAVSGRGQGHHRYVDLTADAGNRGAGVRRRAVRA